MEFLKRGVKMLIISSYPPRECGLATFSHDVVKSIRKVWGNSLPVEICALQNDHEPLSYSDEVSYVLNTSQIDQYITIAEKINSRDDIGMVCVQHEFGLHSGKYGSHLMALLMAINKPILTVFHTIIPHPDEKRLQLIQSIANLSKKIVVLTHRSKELLEKHYQLNQHQITVIPHGTHQMLFNDKNRFKELYDYSNNIVLSTFGLLGESKNIESVLHLLPKIIQKHPQVVYLIIGKTHPEITKKGPDAYRQKLEKLVKSLQLEQHVVFINRFVSLTTLLDYLALTDIYLFTSKDPNQAVSGTLSYAVASGCAVIATPIPHAQELLSASGMVLNNFSNPDEFEGAINTLIEDNNLRIQIGKNGYMQSQATTWENCAIRYGLIYGALTHKDEDLRFNNPKIKLDHIWRLTTKRGIIQFSKLSVPDPSSGYTLDDNARALLALVMFYETFFEESALALIDIYLFFIENIQRADGYFDNYKDANGNLTSQNDMVNLDDANGRAIWSLGYLLARKSILPAHFSERALLCWRKAMRNLSAIRSPRAISYIIKGLYQYYQVSPEREIREKVEEFSQHLLNHYHINASESWQWYEQYMSYANHVIPEAMMYSYLVTQNKNHKAIAEITFDFLLSHYFMKGKLKVISSQGWFDRKNERTFSSEQPIEVSTTIAALDLFYEVTGKNKYRKQIEVAFSWFLGNNHLNQRMYNTANGASYDGLEDKEVNLNQGAESTICFLRAQLIMEKYRKELAYGKLAGTVNRQFAT